MIFPIRYCQINGSCVSANTCRSYAFSYRLRSLRASPIICHQTVSLNDITAHFPWDCVVMFLNDIKTGTHTYSHSPMVISCRFIEPPEQPSQIWFSTRAAICCNTWHISRPHKLLYMQEELESWNMPHWLLQRSELKETPVSGWLYTAQQHYKYYLDKKALGKRTFPYTDSVFVNCP